MTEHPQTVAGRRLDAALEEAYGENADATRAIVQIESEASQKEDKYPAYEVYASIEAWVTRMGEGGKSLQETDYLSPAFIRRQDVAELNTAIRKAFERQIADEPIIASQLRASYCTTNARDTPEQVRASGWQRIDGRCESCNHKKHWHDPQAFYCLSALCDCEHFA